MRSQEIRHQEARGDTHILQIGHAMESEQLRQQEARRGTYLLQINHAMDFLRVCTSYGREPSRVSNYKNPRDAQKLIRSKVDPYTVTVPTCDYTRKPHLLDFGQHVKHQRYLRENF